MSPKSTALCLFLIGATVTADAQAATGSNPQGVILILSLVAAAIWMVIVAVKRNHLDKGSNELKVQMEKLLADRTDFVPSHSTYSLTGKSLLAIDESNFQLTMYFVQGTSVMVRTVPISFILSHQVLVNQAHSSIGLGTAVIGDSSILGVGKGFAFTDVHEVTLQLMLNSTENPLLNYSFLSSAAHGKFDEKSKYVKDALEEASRMNAILEVLIHRQRTQVDTAPAQDTEREIEVIHLNSEFELKKLDAEERQHMETLDADHKRNMRVLQANHLPDVEKAAEIRLAEAEYQQAIARIDAEFASESESIAKWYQDASARLTATR